MKEAVLRAVGVYGGSREEREREMRGMVMHRSADGQQAMT
jgi:hypothetical protein